MFSESGHICPLVTDTNLKGLLLEELHLIYSRAKSRTDSRMHLYLYV